MDQWLAFILEWTAAAFGFACVCLVIRQSIWCWPVGLVQVLLYIFVFLHARLYSDVILHVIYVGLQIYGWWAWLHGGRERGSLPISRLSPQALACWVGAAGIVTFGWGALMARLTDADLPYWDAATTVLSLVAQYLLARKVLENWLFWITVDVLCVGIYAVKGLYVTTGLYAVFLILAIMGLLAWTRSLSTRLAPVPA